MSTLSSFVDSAGLRPVLEKGSGTKSRTTSTSESPPTRPAPYASPYSPSTPRATSKHDGSPGPTSDLLEVRA